MFTRASRTIFTVSLVLVLAACAKQENAELQWARAALQRNPNFELVATDEHNGTFTLRDKQTGEGRGVGLQDIGAAPVSALAAPPAPAPSVAAAPTPAASPAVTASPPAA